MHLFDSDMTLRPTGNGKYAGRVSDHWSHRGIVNGGFLLALAYKAMAHQGRKHGCLVVTGNYSGKTSPGELELLVESISSTKNFDRFEARLLQESKECLRAFGTFSSRGGDTRELPGAENPEDLLPPEQCTPLPNPGNTRLFDTMDIRLDPRNTGWLSGNLSSDAVQRGWIAFREPREFDAPAIVMAADCFPPAVMEALGPAEWIPTVEYSVQVRSLPGVKALRGIFRTRYVTGEMIEEDGVLCAPNGSLVALSRQTALYRKKV